MKPATFAADVDVAARYVEAGAQLLRLVASRLGKGEPGLEDAAPQLLAFIADGMLDRSEILRCTAEQAVSRRMLLGSVAAAPLLPPEVATASSADADLVALATELRTIETAYNEGCREPYEWSETPEAQALMIRLESLIKCMSATPATGLAGIAAKAGSASACIRGRVE